MQLHSRIALFQRSLASLALRIPRPPYRLPQSLLRLPQAAFGLRRRQALALWKAAIVLAGLSVAYVGYEEARLKIHCWTQAAICAKDLAAEAGSGPLWVRLEALAPPVDVALEASESGTSKGVFFPLVSPGEPGTAVAVVRAPGSGDAFRLQGEHGTVPVEGLAYLPRRGEADNIATYLARLNLRAAPNLRVVELGRTPSSLLAALLWVLAGTGLVAFGLRGLETSPQPAPNSIVTITDYENEPLPEDVKVEVRNMLDNVWEEVRQ